MRCAKCGADVKPTDICCPNCAASSTQSQTVNGIEQGRETGGHIAGETPYCEYKNSGFDPGIHIRRIDFLRWGFWPKLLGAALLIVIVILALPFVALVTVSCLVWWFFLRRRHRY